uniref:CASP-like protein n=1 Tax=Echinococcus granulosus TaxID=6210 RepID=A0A068WY37_ECHGR|nr:hypothetical protein EgrG_002040400 [Echinococcus granulosus]
MIKRGLMAFMRSSLDRANNTWCFNYIINESRWKGSGCRLMMLRMQNNLIACVIVVFLCIISSSIVGAISVLARMVPAAMVNAYLYLTACKSTPSVVTRLCHFASFDSFIAIGMQNNLIAYVVIDILCIISSSIVGAVSVLACMVPAAIVKAYLNLIACKFRLLVFPGLVII